MRSVRFSDNGLKILVQEVHTAPLVSVWCWYRVGSGDELPGPTGVSHWVEHMNFKGTDEHPPRPDEGDRRAVRRHVERLYLDRPDDLSRDGREATRSTRCCSSKPSGWRNGLYEPDECESERTVIISELQGGENDPDQLLDTEVTATAFRAHAYRHPTIGWIDDLRSMTRDDLYGHYRRYYIPEQRHAGRRRRRRCRRGAARARKSTSARIAADAAAGAARAPPSRRRSASGASLHRARRDDRRT